VSRRAVLVFIHLFLAAQLALPLSYYLSREVGYDERFAWRMFSAERMATCAPVFQLGEARRRVPLMATFHEAWVTLAQRGRRDVIEAMAARLCRDNPGEPVRLDLRCEEPARPGDPRDARRPGFTTRVLQEGLWDLCPSGRY
jgi:hypothetical protein